MNATINLDRLAEVQAMELSKGNHKSPQHGMCVMEAVAYVAGEPWTDCPACASVVIATFLRNWNDALPTDADRTRLLVPLVADIVGTKGNAAIEKRRSYMALDWLVREFLPAWLELTVDLQGHAQTLRGLPEIVDSKTTQAAKVFLDAAWDAAGAAARAAAWDAAWPAAGAAAGAAARAAAGAAARAAAGDAAGSAVWDAARAAAGDAARAHLSGTVGNLQQSATLLVRRMIDARVAQ